MSIIKTVGNMGVMYNVSFKVFDSMSGKLVKEHIGHNQACNSLLMGIAHYLKGDGVLNQGSYMLEKWIPRYISLGTMGLINQKADANGLPAGIGDYSDSEVNRFINYMKQTPGYGADGYDSNLNNNRKYPGLGPVFKNTPVQCELISPSFPRSEITYRTILDATEAEYPETVDIVYSAMISTGALAQFRDPDKNYLFITESGLWSKSVWSDSGENGLLAGYRIIPPNSENWDMTNSANRSVLKKEILKVGINQVVQVIWKIQIGSIKQVL